MRCYTTLCITMHIKDILTEIKSLLLPNLQILLPNLILYLKIINIIFFITTYSPAVFIFMEKTLVTMNNKENNDGLNKKRSLFRELERIKILIYLIIIYIIIIGKG